MNLIWNKTIKNMNFISFKSNDILKILLYLNILLVVSIFLIYRTISWPLGPEALGCLVSFLLLIITVLLLTRMKNKLIDENQKRNITIGLYLGLLWTIEISINNFIRPGLPYRDIIDNIFLGIIPLLILINAIRDAYQLKRFLFGVKSGLWSGLSSGVIASTTGLLLIVFGMKFILLDPLNIKEWQDVNGGVNTSGMSVYFAYETFAGSIMHLYILGLLLGVILGVLGGFIGWSIVKIKPKK
jgi:hypothetical protein